MSKSYNLGWGESVAVRKAFLETINFNPIVFDLDAMLDMGYPAHEGDEKLVELTKKVIKRQIGKDYKYVLITNGATGAITISLRAFKRYRGAKFCVTFDPPRYMLYPAMIAASDLKHIYLSQHDLSEAEKSVYLIDSLSNPLGEWRSIKKNIYSSPIIWDAVYHGKIYCPDNTPQPEHDVLIGSYSKVTGLNGIRIGWIATNDPSLYDIMADLVTAEYSGISVASAKIVMETVGKMTNQDWERFEEKARQNLEQNKKEFSKLKELFTDAPTHYRGMFFYAPVNQRCKEILEKSNIIWTPGDRLGHSSEYGRFNVGQDCDLIKEAVLTILENSKT